METTGGEQPYQMEQWQSGTLDVLQLLHDGDGDATFSEFASLFDIDVTEEALAIKREHEGTTPDGEATTPFANAFKSGSHNSTNSFTVPDDLSDTYSLGHGMPDAHHHQQLPQELPQQQQQQQTAAQLKQEEKERQQEEAKQTTKRRRVRNAQQMELNRQAQQRYRQRKKNEQSELQSTVDMLAAQMAALQALQQRYAELQGASINTQSQLTLREQQVISLEAAVSEQAARLTLADQQLAKQQKLIIKQQEVIMTQQQKMQLQQDIISQLKDRLRVSVEEATEQLNASNPGSVCQVMINAVKGAILSAEDVNGIHAAVVNMPDSMLHEISRRVLEACKQLWPELMEKACKKHLNCDGMVAAC